MGPALTFATDPAPPCAGSPERQVGVKKSEHPKPARTDKVVSPAMWGSLLGVALLMAFNPALLGLILLLISRSRPVQNLLAYWAGCVVMNVPILLAPLLVLHSTPTFTSFSHDLATPTTAASSTVRHIQFGMGVLVLAIAAVMAVRFFARRRAQVPATSGNSSTLVLDSDTPDPTSSSSPFGRAGDASTEGASPFRRLLGRLQSAWDSGSLWVAFVLGMALLPGPYLVIFIDTTIVTSGVPLGAQVVAVIGFVIAMLGVIEITLISYLVTPVKTQAVLRPVHEWALAHRQQILLGIFAVVGVALVTQSLGIGVR